ncbi:PadR family transcriptional regulator [Tsukamurella paurometabola]|uniref:Transcriptional regulator, Acidobacterial, PadR-family n=1 Tax=Tsukamurella paurometabola TaxID=2061 RepID=A0A3P8KR64_TSUPA|nr:PadR family transcriptional regulator [Tsukamurella paurometabola]UEA81848.1 PadR family transcriptional regulator [Tsukamurella paurometabola]VDR38867.1 transcriptional regulator, Acidobacterial, PadR-family [Tsukamurella paurometabola]
MDLVRDLLRGVVPVHVLHHAAEDGGVYGAWMADELAHHGYRISPGTLYPLLQRLEDAGLLTSAEQTVEGRVRRIYTATVAGIDELGNLRRVIAELSGELLEGTASAGNPR